MLSRNWLSPNGAWFVLYFSGRRRRLVRRSPMVEKPPAGPGASGLFLGARAAEVGWAWPRSNPVSRLRDVAEKWSSRPPAGAERERYRRLRAGVRAKAYRPLAR
jgi:hypothetical protein